MARCPGPACPGRSAKSLRPLHGFVLHGPGDIALGVGEEDQVTDRLDVKRQVLTAFRERRVQLASVPRRFLAQLAAALDSSMEKLDAYLSLPPAQNLVRSYKANTKPGTDAPVTFEQLLIEAKIPAEKRAILMAEDE